ncbi:MlaD family protein [Gordonia polyisoprenivorans]|uniref:MlaD family protein n=1 Tax=Gordonia polyisoprenivorans TaxID=84595 RepID=UPI001AD6D047|nr:MlaD family protein [Gordonia polyisoprenivorans]QTI70872.1 MCE family protein [Gordonia polyisoprenivorans]
MRKVTQRSSARRGSWLSRFSSSDALLGIGVVVLAIVVLGVFGIIYIRPPDQKTISFETTDASAIETGADVRVAGVSVGKVSSISIGQDAVTVDARIDNNTWVGDLSRIEVRMLTPVGGYAVTLIPLGRSETAATIPASRVSVPYSIGDVLQQAPKVTDDVKASTVNANLAQVAQALQGNSTSLRSIVDGMNSITTVFDQQRTQVHQIAALAQEYLQTFNANREFVFDLINKIDTVVTTYNNNSAGFNYTYKLLGSILSRLMPFEKFYLEHSDLVRQNVYAIRDAILAWQKQMGPAIDGLLSLRDRLAQWIGPDGMRQLGGGTVDLNNLCIPVPGKDC